MPTRTLILNADDLGYDPAVTRGILRSMREGVVSSTTLMVNTPFSVEAAEESQGLAVGLHLNLARGLPCAADFPSDLLTDGALDERKAALLPADTVLREARAQLRRLEALRGEPATHVDVHKHLHRLPGVLEGVIAAAQEARIPVRSIHPAMREALRRAGVPTNDHFVGDAGATAYWTEEELERQLDLLPASGVIELMCHPGYVPTSLQSGYAQQREVELATFLSPRAREAFARRGLSLATFRALKD